MRYCEKCGTPNADDAKFCRKCGNRFKAGSSYLKYILLLVIVCVFIVVCIISFGVTQQTVLPLADQEASSVSSDIVKDSEFDTEAKIEASSLDKDEKVNLEDYLKDLSWTQDELNRTELQKFSSADLRILRNAIFAKHGYIFKDPELADFFTKYSWYTPLNDNVYNDLTNMEKRNIAIIGAPDKPCGVLCRC